MRDGRDHACCADPGWLLAQAVRYAVGNVAAVTPDRLPWPTPCRGWDLDMLLRHGCESLAALAEAFTTGCVWLDADDADGHDADRGVAATGGAVEVFVDRACSLLGSRADSGWPAIAVGSRALPADVLTAAGALEIAVHGWDIAQASGSRLPIPSPLADRLLDVAPQLVTSADRASLGVAPLFAAPLAIGCEASASDRLTAFLGRPGLQPCPGAVTLCGDSG
jgi:uncharacterized protein (TIGR03086 family)